MMENGGDKSNAGLTEAEAAVYDRQLRVWGVETQKRLSSSNVLIAGSCNGLAAEVAKNIVLAGVGSVDIADGTPCSARPAGNFLIFADVAPLKTVAEASAETLQEMNPLVKVAAIPGTMADILKPEALKKYNLLLLVAQPYETIRIADEACTASGTAFYAAECRSVFGWAFANLHTHDYKLEHKKELPDGTTSTTMEDKTLQYPSWPEAMAASMTGRKLKRTSPLLLLLRSWARFEATERHAVSPADGDALHALSLAICHEEKLDPARAVEDAARAYAEHPGEMPAVAAVVGGVVANDVLKAVSGKGDPHVQNLFMFSLVDTGGYVDRLGFSS